MAEWVNIRRTAESRTRHEYIRLSEKMAQLNRLKAQSIEGSDLWKSIIKQIERLKEQEGKILSQFT